MPPHKTATLLQQFQHYRAIPEFMDLQHRPFLWPGRADPEYPEMPRPAGPRRMLVAVPSPSFPVGAVVHPGGWSPIRECDNAPLPSSIEHARQVPRAVWTTPAPAWSFRRDSPIPQGERLTLESTNSNEPGDRDARHRSVDLAPILSASGAGNRETSVIRRRVTALVWLDKAQGRRYYRPHSGR